MKRILVLVATLLSSYGIASPVDSIQLAKANSAFAFNLLKQLAHDQPAENIFISPYSASAVMQMVGSGAAGKTKTEMDQVLGTQGMSPKSLGEANKAIAESLNNLNANVIMNTANAIWYRSGDTIKPDFLDVNRRFFGSTVEPVDFADPHCVDIINAWASEKTHGRISRIADGMIDPVYSQLFLANAVYFKGQWLDRFDTNATMDQPFYLRGGARKTVPMMTKMHKFQYCHGNGYQAVRLPYRVENLAMFVFLPDTNSTPEQLLGYLNDDIWRHETKPGLSQQEGLLMLPKFKLEYEVKLVPILKSMGMNTAFDMTKADFSGIGPQLYISEVLQKTFVDVKEEGTEAAAVTGGMVTSSAAVTPGFEMIVDRPFMFLIEDNQTSTILFMGLIFEPKTD